MKLILNFCLFCQFEKKTIEMKNFVRFLLIIQLATYTSHNWCKVVDSKQIVAAVNIMKLMAKQIRTHINVV